MALQFASTCVSTSCADLEDSQGAEDDREREGRRERERGMSDRRKASAQEKEAGRKEGEERTMRERDGHPHAESDYYTLLKGLPIIPELAFARELRQPCRRLRLEESQRSFAGWSP